MSRMDVEGTVRGAQMEPSIFLSLFLSYLGVVNIITTFLIKGNQHIQIPDISSIKLRKYWIYFSQIKILGFFLRHLISN